MYYVSILSDNIPGNPLTLVVPSKALLDTLITTSLTYGLVIECGIWQELA